MVEAFVFNETLSDAEQEKVGEAFRRLRLERLQKMSSAEKLMADLLQLKYRLQKHSSGEIPAHYWWRILS